MRTGGEVVFFCFQFGTMSKVGIIFSSNLFFFPFNVKVQYLFTVYYLACGNHLLDFVCVYGKIMSGYDLVVSDVF